MSLRSIGFIVGGIAGASVLATSCTYQPPGARGQGGGAQSASSTSGGGESSGTAGMGGTAGATASSGQGGGTATEWWNASWAHRVRITFDNTSGEVIEGFPLMVRLDGERIMETQASMTGADLRFIDADGQTELPYEIDRWTPGKESFVWVRVPTIDPTNTDHIWLYYGNPDAKDAQDAAAVWNDFIGVYHLSPSSDVFGQFPDSAGTSPGVWNGGVAGSIVSGPIADGIGLDGWQFVQIGDNDPVSANVGQARTVEAWVNASQLSDQSIVYEEGGCVGWSLGLAATGDYLGTFITDPVLPFCGPGATDYFIGTPASTGSWHYVVLVIDRPGLQMRLYVDGAFMTLTNVNNTEMADSNGFFRIGSDHDGGPGSFIGSIDEVRVSNGSRTSAWIAAQHKSMTDKFLSFKVE